MTKKTILACGATLAVLGILTAGILGGCNSSDDEERRLSRKGEVCQTSNDCAGGLSCVPLPASSSLSSGAPSTGICVTGEFRIEQNSKECVTILCEQPLDCCPTPPSSCASLQLACADGGSTFACQQYDSLCKCDALKWDCLNNKCQSRCNLDTECGTNHCSAGKCVQCVDDSHCGPGQKCVSGSCKAPCTADTQCPGFNRCRDGECVDEGCLTSRECVAWTRNVEAVCGTDKKCIVPCQTDLECGNPLDYRFYSCINHQCTYTGCLSDKECSLRAQRAGTFVDAGPSGNAVKYLCQDRQTQGADHGPNAF